VSTEIEPAPAPPLPRYDELRAPDGAVRPEWAYLADALEALGPRELAQRAQHASRILHQDGATYTLAPSAPLAGGIANELQRPWTLDPVPFVLTSEEWASVERGLIQRAELLDLLLRDLYGDQTLITRGLVPPEVVYGHDGYLRAVRGITPRGERALVLAACDLVRTADGSLVVLGDRTQAPSGAGYALENRRVMNQVFPSLFRDAHVHRLAGWFRALRTALQELVPADGGEGRIVVLTPGAGSETYFEHAFLATNLGCPLVEGADLTVRSGRVWLRSLGALEPVDVILRRVDDVWCDPLELRDDSWLGLAGLVEATRRGTVAVVNPIGAGVVENPGLAPFLPALATELLGTDLALPCVPSWWCGGAEDRRFVLDHLGELVLKPISRSWGSVPIVGRLLEPDELEAWRRIVAAEPWRWVGQQHLSHSLAPSFVEGGIVGRPAVVRAHLAAEADSYTVMPGGLTRVGRRVGDHLVSNSTGASSKDTWILASEPERQVSLWSSSVDLSPGGPDERAIPSRTSENLFWMGRYAERAEATIRLTRVILERLDDPMSRRDPVERARLALLLGALTHLTSSYPGFLGGEPDHPGIDHPEPGLLEVLTSSVHRGTLDSSLRNLLTAAYAVRDRLSADTWQVVSDLEDDLTALRRLGSNLLAVRVVIDRLLRALLALAGLAQESMVRDAGWRLLDTGRRIERGTLLCSITRSLLVPPAEPAAEPFVLESFLAASENLVAYRRRSRANLSAPAVLDLVLAEPTNPRSLRHQLDRLGDDLTALPRTTRGQRAETEERLVLDAATRLRLADAAVLATRVESTNRRDALDDVVGQIADLLTTASDAVAARLFTHLQPGPRLVGVTWREGDQ
jgi:uncharacterized circularly permuted ATP-grasp superfamily protein/uncharacterized alpha-E superfamily protein